MWIRILDVCVFARFYILWFVNNSNILSNAFVRSFVIVLFLLHFVLVSSPFTIQHTLHLYIFSFTYNNWAHRIWLSFSRWAIQKICECIKSINWHRYKIHIRFEEEKKKFSFSTNIKFTLFIRNLSNLYIR